MREMRSTHACFRIHVKTALRGVTCDFESSCALRFEYKASDGK